MYPAHSQLIYVMFMFFSYPDTWFEDITSNQKFYSLAATINSKIIGIIVSEIKTRTRCNREVFLFLRLIEITFKVAGFAWYVQ